MIADDGKFALLEMPVPRLITTEAQWLNMNTQDIHIELADNHAQPSVRIKDEIFVLKPKKVSVFHSNVDRSGGPLACWPWKKRLNRDGYGALAVHGKYIGAHRMAYQIKHGPISPLIQVLHNCPNGDLPSCCNPAHLWLGTQRENILDMERKGRAKHPTGNDSGLRKHPESVMRGERASNAKMSDIKVRMIRGLFATKLFTKRELGEMFGVTATTASMVILRKSWAHIK